VEADLHHLRRLAAEHMAKLILESIPDQGHLLGDPFLDNLLLQKSA
jgi:hypothetical protein